MRQLDDIDVQDREMIISLPYRVGLAVSRSDLGGGEEAVAKEMAALEQIVQSYTQDFCKSEFVQTLMEETLRACQREHFWNDSFERVPEECRKAVDILSSCIESGDMKSFKSILMEIGLAVAMAFSERRERPAGGILVLFYGLASLFRPKSRLRHENISRQEKRLLKKLAFSLGMRPDYI